MAKEILSLDMMLYAKENYFSSQLPRNILNPKSSK